MSPSHSLPDLNDVAGPTLFDESLPTETTSKARAVHRWSTLLTSRAVAMLKRSTLLLVLLPLLGMSLSCLSATDLECVRHDDLVTAGLQLVTEPALTLPSTASALAYPAHDFSRYYVMPYTPVDIMSDFWACRGRRRHAGIDFQGVGPDAGLGTPIYAMGRSRIVTIGRPSEDSRRFGRRLRRRHTTRGGRRLPARADIEGYGRVYFFTRNRGQWRTGTIVVTELLDGPLAGYTVRYMHLGEVHPALSVGDEVLAGEEIAIMGGTAVQSSMPHLHLDIEDADGNRINPALYLGLDVEVGEISQRCN